MSTDLFKDSLPNGTTGQTTVGTSVVQLRSSSLPLNSGVIIKAENTNAGIVYVGFEGVTTTKGFSLSAGESVPITIDDLSKIWAVASQASQSVSWIAQ